MDATALKTMQAPLKEAYRGDASQALITLRAKGSIDDQSVACKVETGRAIAIAGLHPATGGAGLELCSGDMLLEALVACAGVEGGGDSAGIQARRRHGGSRRRSRFSRHFGGGKGCRSASAPSGSISVSTPMNRRSASTHSSS
jgi:hypothetical protein